MVRWLFWGTGLATATLAGDGAGSIVYIDMDRAYFSWTFPCVGGLTYFHAKKQSIRPKAPTL